MWRQVWSAAKVNGRQLFQTSLDTGTLPRQWRIAKIVPLKKPSKDDYTRAKAWRPISLLSTLGKLLKAVIAERTSFAVETPGLLPTNRLGAREKSAEQALLFRPWTHFHGVAEREVVSLFSFDVKGAYNAVCRNRLLQRLAARGTPLCLVKWVDALCSRSSATIEMNGREPELSELGQAGLPQGFSLPGSFSSTQLTCSNGCVTVGDSQALQRHTHL